MASDSFSLRKKYVFAYCHSKISQPFDFSVVFMERKVTVLVLGKNYFYALSLKNLTAVRFF